MRALIVVLIFLVGCHGTELRVGGGQQFNDFKGSLSADSGGGDYDKRRDSSSASSASFDQDDSSMVWAEVAFQLTPQSVVIHNQESRITDADRFYPFSPPEPENPMAEVVEKLDEAIERLERVEEESITWGDIGLKGGATGLAGGLAWWAWLLFERRRKEKVEVQTD